MTTTNKFIGVIIVTLMITQIVIIYLEGTWIVDPEVSRDQEKIVYSRIICPAADEKPAGKYLVNRFYKSEGFGVNEINPNDVTITLHGTIDQLHRLIEFERLWLGPISMSVFAPGLDAGFLDDAIDGIRLCWSNLRKSVTFHVVYPETVKANMTNVGSFVYLSCKDIIRRLKRREKSDFTRLTYPRNVMRNVARSGVFTHWILDLDEEMFPTSSLRARFLSFVKKFQGNVTNEMRSIRKVFVLPAFEVRRDSDDINNKNQLQQALKEKNARPYMQEICPRCQKALNYELWAETNSSGTDLNISHSVRYTPEWEPFFIASRTSPSYDERINSEGFDRLFHMCKLQSLDYKFFVLNDEFLLHLGYQGKEKLTPIGRYKRENSKAFRKKFQDLLKAYNYTGSNFNHCYS